MYLSDRQVVSKLYRMQGTVPNIIKKIDKTFAVMNATF